MSGKIFIEVPVPKELVSKIHIYIIRGGTASFFRKDLLPPFRIPRVTKRETSHNIRGESTLRRIDHRYLLFSVYLHQA